MKNFIVIFVAASKEGSKHISYNGNIFQDGSNVFQFSIPCEDYGDFCKWWEPKVKELAGDEEYRAYDHTISTTHNDERFEMNC
jgi:hypothetical protein